MSEGPAVYLDHHATTPLDPRVLEAMLPYFTQDFGNASSASHAFGWRAEAAVEDARERIAAGLGVESDEVVFTSGATESNNLALRGLFAPAVPNRNHIVSVAIEHPSVLEVCADLVRRGCAASIVAVDSEGRVDVDAIASAIREETRLLSISAANSEIGVLQPMAEIAALAHERGLVLHCDAAQAVGKIALDLSEAAIDLLSFSGHKIYGPKGVGVLVVRNRSPRLKLHPLLMGGGQERGLRSGTLPVPLIVGLARALELCLVEREAEATRLAQLRDRLHTAIRSELAGVGLNGPAAARLPGNLSLSFGEVDGERLLLALRDIAVSSGSACSSGSTRPSHVLKAIGHSDSLARATLRFGLGRGTTCEHVDRAAQRVVEEVNAQRRS